MNQHILEIVIVEDNPDDLEMTLRTLRKRNLANHVHVARDGAEAIDFLFSQGLHAGNGSLPQPKVIFLDLKLPKVNGVEVLQRLKSDDRTKNIPVVVLTSSKEDKDLSLCYALGVNSYIVKPIDFDSFSKVIADIGLYWLMLNERPR